MKLLERYLLQVERYLPLKDRKDTTLELKNLLLEDIDSRITEGQPEDDAVYEVLKAFGEPKKVALSYRSDDPIISREMEPILYLVLKIVLIAVPFSILLSTIIGFLNNGLPFDFIDFLVTILKTIPAMFSAALTGVGSTFIVFAIIERFLKPQFLEELEKQEIPEFDPLHLPKIPDSVFKVSLVESIIALAGGIIFLYIFNYQPGIIAIYFDGDTVPLLNDSFGRILPMINVSIVFGIFIEVIHLIKRSKTIITSTLELMNKVLITIIYLLLATYDVLNQVILAGYHLEVLGVIFIIGMYIGATTNFFGGIYTYAKVLISQSGKKEIIKDLINKQK